MAGSVTLPVSFGHPVPRSGNISDESRRRPAQRQRSGRPHRLEELATSCLRAACSFHSRSRLNSVNSSSIPGLSLAAAEHTPWRAPNAPRDRLGHAAKRTRSLPAEAIAFSACSAMSRPRADRRDLGMAGAFLRNALDQLLCLGEFAPAPTIARARPASASTSAGLALQDLRIECGRAGMIAGLRSFLGHCQRLFNR